MWYPGLDLSFPQCLTWKQSSFSNKRSPCHCQEQGRSSSNSVDHPPPWPATKQRILQGSLWAGEGFWIFSIHASAGRCSLRALSFLSSSGAAYWEFLLTWIIIPCHPESFSCHDACSGVAAFPGISSSFITSRVGLVEEMIEPTVNSPQMVNRSRTSSG